MIISSGGKFLINIPSDKLSSGLRPTSANPRNSTYMSELYGMIGQDGVLQALDELERLSTSVFNEDFPYPQLFILSSHILLCGRLKIYEYVDSTFELKITASSQGSTWRVLDYVDYICMSNGAVTIERNPLTGLFAETTEIPTFNAACDYNGQALIGAVNSNLTTTLAPTTT